MTIASVGLLVTTGSSVGQFVGFIVEGSGVGVATGKGVGVAVGAAVTS